MLDSLKQKKNFQRIKMRLKTGDLVNLEFDIVGKYIAKLIDKRNN